VKSKRMTDDRQVMAKALIALARFAKKNIKM
jgi:hypothetical protein